MKTLKTILIATTFAANANASIISLGGDAAGLYTSAPASFKLGQYEHNTHTRVHLESIGLPILPGTKYDAHNPGHYGSGKGKPSGGTIPTYPWTWANSYLFHFDPTSGVPTKESQGWAIFDAPIYVLSSNENIDNTDTYYGYKIAGLYPGFLSDRGYDMLTNDEYTISNPTPTTWRIDFHAWASTGMDQLRIIETPGVPAPGAAGLLAAGALLAARRRRR